MSKRVRLADSGTPLSPDSPFNLDNLNFESCLGGQRTFFREAWDKMSLKFEPRPEDQILKIRNYYSTIPFDRGYRLSHEQLARIFDLSTASFQRRARKAEDRANGIAPKPHGRPLLLNPEQERLLYDEIERREALLNPPEPIEVTHWLNTTLKVECSPKWILKWVNRSQTDRKPLFCVRAQPMEPPRARVTSEMLLNWADKDLIPNLPNFHPCLFFNFDETSDAPRRDARIKRVISTKEFETTYVSQREGITICD